MGIAPKNPKHPAWSFGTLPGQPSTKPQTGMVEPEPVTDEERLKRVIGLTFGTDEGEITANANLVADLEFDSLDIVELAMAVEEEFDFQFDEDFDFDGLVTFRQWLYVIKKREATNE